MTFLAKFIYSALVTTIITGGGVGIGLSSKQSSSPTNYTSLETSDQGTKNLVKETRRDLEQQKEIDSPKGTSIHEVISPVGGELSETQTPLSSPQVRDSSNDTEDTIAREEEQVGNCTLVENPQKVMSKIPHSVAYFSVSCQNSEFSEMDVEKWVGIFPADLLQNSGRGFQPRNKFSINVEDQGMPSEGIEAYQTLFTGDKFLKSPLTGRWGSSLLEGEDDEESIVAYIVELVNPETSKNFYIFKPE